MSTNLPRLSRRATLAWVIAASAGPLAGCGFPGDPSGWRELKLKPVDAAGYGPDPDLTNPSAPWPLTLSAEERAIARIAADLIVPGEGEGPGAGALEVDAFLDEWVSAPYPNQQADRTLLVSGLRWLDAEAKKRFDVGFSDAQADQQRQIFDDIAFRDRVKEGYAKPAAFFDRLRALVLAGYFSLPQGIAEIGYLGNTPILGPYPGPSPQALAHLREALSALGLAMPD